MRGRKETAIFLTCWTACEEELQQKKMQGIFRCLMLHSPGSRLSGLHLVAFEDTSIRVSAGCIKEINRPRSCYHTDLAHIEVPVTRKHASAKLPVLQLLMTLPPKRLSFLCLKNPLHLHQRLQLLLVKCKVHSLFIVLVRSGSMSLVAF